MNIAKECLKDRTSAVRASAILLIGDVIKYGKIARLPFEDMLGMQVSSQNYLHKHSICVRRAPTKSETCFCTSWQVYNDIGNLLDNRYCRFKFLWSCHRPNYYLNVDINNEIFITATG